MTLSIARPLCDSWASCYWLVGWLVGAILQCVFIPPQAVHRGGCLHYVPSPRANMDSSAGRASPLHTCNSGGIIRPRAVFSCLALFFNCQIGCVVRLVAWHSGRTSVKDRRTFPFLRSTYTADGWPLMWENRPL